MNNCTSKETQNPEQERKVEMMGFMSRLRERKWSKTSKAIAAVLLGASLLMSGCGGGSKSASTGGSAAKGGKALTIGMTNAPKSFNPLTQPDAAGQFVMRFMYDTLLGQPEPQKFTPHLAKSFETKDNKTYTVKIDPNAKWSDGKPITADDVIFTINLIANPKVESSLGRYIKPLAGLSSTGKLKEGQKLTSVIKIDDKTVEFVCRQPLDPNYVKNSLGFNVSILPKHIFEKIDPAKIPSSKAVQSPSVVSGPYKFTKYVTNDHIELAANDGFVLGAPKIKKIFIKIQNGTNLVVDLKAGKVQMSAGAGIGKVSINDIDVLKKEKNLVVKDVPSLGSQYIMPNDSDPEMNVHFRKALVHAVNRKQLVDQLYKGYGAVYPTMYTAASPVYDKTVKNPEYNVELAKKELAASGYDVNKEIVLMVPLGNVQREQSADLIQQNLQAIGLKVKLQKMDFPTLMTHNKKGDFKIMLMGLTLSADPDYMNLYETGGVSNFQKTADPKLMDMMSAAAFEADSAKRTQRYHEIQHYMAEQMFNIPLYGEQDFIIQNKKPGRRPETLLVRQPG